MLKKVLWKNSKNYYSDDMKNWIDNPNVWFESLEIYDVLSYPDNIYSNIKSPYYVQT